MNQKSKAILHSSIAGEIQFRAKFGLDYESPPWKSDLMTSRLQRKLLSKPPKICACAEWKCLDYRGKNRLWGTSLKSLP